MTIEAILTLVQKTKPSLQPDERLIEWLDECDKRIITEVISNYELSDAEEARFGAFVGYDNTTPMTQELLVPDPYSVLYRWWLEAQIDLANLEMPKYNNSTRLYKDAVADFSSWWIRTHMPVHQVTHISY